MASLRDLASKAKQLFSDFGSRNVGNVGNNLKAWGQVATQPQLRQDYSNYVVKPVVQKVTQPIKNYAQQVQEAKQTPFFNNTGNNPIQWLGKVAQDVKQRGPAEGFHDITYPITTSPYLRPIFDKGTSAVRVANYKAGRPVPLVNTLLGQQDWQMAPGGIPRNKTIENLINQWKAMPSNKRTKQALSKLIEEVQKTAQTAKQYATTPGPKYNDFANLGPVRQPFAYASAKGMFGPLPQVARQVTQAFPKTTLPVSHYFAGSSLLPVEDIALGARLPEKEKYGTARLAGAASTALITGGPKLLIKSALTGGGLGTAFQVGKNILNKEPLLKDVGSSALASGKYGVQTAQTMQLTNGLVNSLSKFVPFLKPLTEGGIEKTLPGVQMTLNQAFKKIGTTLFKRVVKAALIETPIEGITYGISQREEGQKLIDSIANQTVQNFIYNVGYAGVNTAWDARVVGPILKRSVDQAIDQYKALPLEVRSGGGGDINAKIGVSPTVKTSIGESGGEGVRQALPETKLSANTVLPEAGKLKISPQENVKTSLPSESIIAPKKTISSLESQIEQLTGPPPTTGNFKQDFAIRQKFISEIKEQMPPEILKQVDDLELQIENLRQAKISSKPISNNDTILAEAKQRNLVKEIRASVEKLSTPIKSKIKSYLDTLDKQYFSVHKDWENKVSSINVKPNEQKVAFKIKTREANAKLKFEDTQYKQWQKQVFGEANTRTTTKAVNDFTKAIKTSTNQSILDTADTWKDKPKISYTRETMERNFEDIMGKDAPVMKKKILEPIFSAEAQRNKFLKKERADIKALGIKARSKESALVQDLGEGKITVAQVKQQSPNADKIINAESVLRQKYDQYLTQLNTVLTRNGYDPIPKRKDYFHHFEDLKGAFEQIGVAIKAQDLPTDINGLSADFKPGKTFFSAALQRKGEKTSVDAITGIDKYLEGASNQIFHTDNIQSLRAFETAIREKYAGTDHLSNFVADLGEYTNKLAGKKAMFDRAIESIVGRRIYAATNALKAQTVANMVGANVSSALTNFIPLTQILATTDKASVAQAALGIIKNTFKDDGFVGSSNFLTSRVGSDKLSLTNWQKIGKTGGWLFQTIDNFTSQLAVRSKYLEGIKKGLPEQEAVRLADSWGRKTLAGRSAGEMPTLFNSKTMGFLTQFQLEVNNQMSFFFKDIPRNFSKVGAAAAMAQVFIYAYIYNNIYEKLTGRRPAFDPIGVAQRTYEDYTNPDMKKGQATKNLVANVGNQLPFTSTLTGGRIPISSAIPDPIALANGTSTWKKELTKPLFYLLPPTGGGQIKKIIEGTSAYNKGASVTDSGRVRYPIPQTPGNRIRTTLFGQYSTPEAQKYFREGTSTLGANQSSTLLNSQDKVGAYNKVIDQRQATKAEDEVKARVEANQKPEVANGFVYYPQGDTIQKIELNPTMPTLELTGQASLDKKLISSYKSAITSQQTDIKKLYELGQLTAQEAETKINALEVNKTSTSKTGSTKKGSAKKVTAKKISMPKFTIAKSKTSSIKIKAMPKPKKIIASKNTITTKKGVVYKIKKPSKVTFKVSAKGSLG